ncbi:hypothetical protein AMECASPLE_039788, partial [Ameca splendens]
KSYIRHIVKSQSRLTSRPVPTPEDVCFIRQSLEVQSIAMSRREKGLNTERQGHVDHL